MEYTFTYKNPLIKLIEKYPTFMRGKQNDIQFVDIYVLKDNQFYKEIQFNEGEQVVNLETYDYSDTIENFLNIGNSVELFAIAFERVIRSLESKKIYISDMVMCRVAMINDHGPYVTYSMAIGVDKNEKRIAA